MRPIIIALAMLTAAACSDAQSSLAALKAAGYSNIAITGWEPFSCGQPGIIIDGVLLEPSAEHWLPCSGRVRLVTNNRGALAKWIEAEAFRRGIRASAFWPGMGDHGQGPTTQRLRWRDDRYIIMMHPLLDGAHSQEPLESSARAVCAANAGR